MDPPNSGPEPKLAPDDAPGLAQIYDELRQLAGIYLDRERSGHTLQPTALVHEAFLKLRNLDDRPRNEAQFKAVAASAIRQVLVDHARSRHALKRGGDRERVTLGDPAAPEAVPVDILALEDALTRLARLSPRQARVVELRFFGGLGERDTAETLEVSERTVRNDWQLARAWLWRELGETASS